MSQCVTYDELLTMAEEHPDSVIAVVPVINENGEPGVFWGSFSMSYRDGDLTEAVAAEAGRFVRVAAVAITCAKTRQVAKEKGMVPQ